MKSDYTINVINNLTGERRSLSVIGYQITTQEINEALTKLHNRKAQMNKKGNKINFNYSSEFYRSRGKDFQTRQRQMDRDLWRARKIMGKNYFTNPKESKEVENG